MASDDSSDVLYYDLDSFIGVEIPDTSLSCSNSEAVDDTEREAKDAISWLKAAGFPQYVQMYADGEFPIDLSKKQVENDHMFLDKAAIESLLRRLRVLNHCADLFVERITKYSKEEERNKEDLRALSSHWRFRKKSKKWSHHSKSAEENGKKSAKNYSFTDGADDQPLLKTQSDYCPPTHYSQSKSEGYVFGNDEPDHPLIGIGSQSDLVNNSSSSSSSSLSDCYEDQELVSKLTIGKQSTGEDSVNLPAVENADETDGLIHGRNENARRARDVWHGFQKGQSFRQTLKPVRLLMPIDELSIGQMTVLRKMSLVRLTSLLEMHNASSKVLSRLPWSQQPEMDKDKKVFGTPLLLNVSQTGCALPQAILNAMHYLRKNGLASEGIFRKTASCVNVSALKELIEANPDYVNYTEFTVYEIADMLKLYFRKLPEALLTDKLSEVLISVQEGIPETGKQSRLQAIQSIMLLMPDENREALQHLLLFLSEVAEQSDINKMNGYNLSVCFAPSIFTLPSMVKTNPLVKSHRRSSFRNRLPSASKPLPSSLESGNKESLAARKCLELMVEQVDKLFMIPSDTIHVCQFSYPENADPVPYHELGQDREGFGDFHSYINTCINATLKECRQNAKDWQYHDNLCGIEVSSLTINDDIPLRVWKGSVEIPTCTENVLRRLWSERRLWDDNLIECRVVLRVDENTEVFQYVTQAPPPLANRDVCILRAWRQCPDNCFAVVSTSVSHPDATLMGSMRATMLAMRFLIEPIGSDASRLTVLNRMDIRGHSSDYYNRCYGAYSTLCVALIRDSFKKHLETQV